MNDTEHDASAAMTARTEDHERLAPFAGTFTAQVKLWVGPGDPIVSTGTMVSELDLGGCYLKQTYTGDPNDGQIPSFEGRGYWGYNTVAKRYEGFWIDNGSTIMQTDTGQVDATGTVWTMTGEMTNPQTGATMTKRTVITLVGTNTHRLEMYFDTGEGESKALEIAYTRKTLRTGRPLTGPLE